MDAKISALEKEYEFLQKKREALAGNMNGIYEKVKRLRQQRDMEASGGLSPAEEHEFRYALSVVGGLLENSEVMFGGLVVEDEEPDKEHDTGYCGDKTPRKYSIDIKSNYVICVCPGLRIRVTIKTKTPAIRRIVQEMVESTEYVPEEEKLEERTAWGIDWDYHDRIKIKNKVSHEDYFKFKDRKGLDHLEPSGKTKHVPRDDW